MRRGLTELSIRYPWIVISIAVLITVFFAFQIPKIKIDTDPQNMLESDEPTRLFHSYTKSEFNLHDFIAVGVVGEPTAFTADQLNRIYAITSEIEDLDGVIADDILAPSTVDDIKQGPGGVLTIEPLMAGPVASDADARYILGRIKNNPILRGKLASDDGKVIALFIPLESKDVSHRVAGQIRYIIDRQGGGAEYHIAGLPLAEDSFGAEMFSQMAFSAPAAMIIIFLLLFMFFRKIKIVLAPMVVAIMSVIWAMGLLIMMGFTVHIMSSMIPIFLIPIAVLNSIHIISEFHDRYKKYKHKDATIRHSIGELFIPMLFTSLTTVAGFVSLTLTPIPPVQVFGAFVAFGIVVAWFLSLTLNPAIAMLISTKTLHNFGAVDDEHGPLTRVMHGFRDFAWRHNLLIIGAAAVVVVVAAVGLGMIQVNDNPVNWFKRSHPIRIADEVMNRHLGGTYMNYLVFQSDEPDAMKNPQTVTYLENVQRELEKDDLVGTTTGLPDVVKKVRYELFGEDSSKAVIPKNQDEIAQMLFLFEMSGGDPDDLFKLVTSDYSKANIWVQMKNGDNQSVSRVVERGNRYIAAHPLPAGVTAKWAGLPYINIKWQHQMVNGMGWSLAGSYLTVFIMMIFLFRSLRWGLISMLPLTITIMAIYAFIGYIGKPYDMPVAVLSSLTLGLSIDFAIHFIERIRMIHRRTGDFRESFHEIFEGAGRAITRNVMVIAIGFVPMLFSSLVPYVTVGSFFLSIMVVSGLVTMLLLPAIIKTFHKALLPEAAVEPAAATEAA